MHLLVRIWQAWASAVCFLTLVPLPVNGSHHFDPRRTLSMFPLCGMCIGLIAAGLDALASSLWTRPAAGFLTVLFLTVITGALHLDGVADTADGLYGRRDPQKALEIMKDSRIGAMGAAALVCCLLLKWVGVWGIDTHRALWIVLIPGYARAAALFGVRFLPYGRPDGTGHSFFSEPLRWTDFWGMALLVGLSMATGSRMALINLGFAAIVTATIAFYRYKINCITGDMLGAMIEICEALLFFLVAAGGAS